MVGKSLLLPSLLALYPCTPDSVASHFLVSLSLPPSLYFPAYVAGRPDACYYEPLVPLSVPPHRLHRFPRFTPRFPFSDSHFPRSSLSTFGHPRRVYFGILYSLEDFNIETVATWIGLRCQVPGQATDGQTSEEG
jgi:hypothetical protein